jgi:hypothetical protein
VYARDVNRILLLTVVLFCLTLVVPLFVWAQSGKPGAAFRAWRQGVCILLALATPGILVALWFFIVGP